VFLSVTFKLSDIVSHQLPSQAHLDDLWAHLPCLSLYAPNVRTLSTTQVIYQYHRSSTISTTDRHLSVLQVIV